MKSNFCFKASATILELASRKWYFPSTRQKFWNFFLVFICIHIGRKHVKRVSGLHFLLLHSHVLGWIQCFWSSQSRRRVYVPTGDEKTTEGCSKLTINYCKYFLFRIFPLTIRALSRVDLFGCSILYSKYYASMHHLHRPLFVTTIPDAIWT